MRKYEILGNKDTRSGFGAGLLEAGNENENVVALCADLTGSLMMDAFKDKYPERFFQAGIAEANMMGVAAGLAIGGKIPLQEPLQISLRVGFTTKFVKVLLIAIPMLKFVLHMQD